MERCLRGGENIVWRTAIPGFADFRLPVVSGDRLFVAARMRAATPASTSRPSLKGYRDASDDDKRQRLIVLATERGEKRTGKILWEHMTYEGRRRIDERHVK